MSRSSSHRKTPENDEPDEHPSARAEANPGARLLAAARELFAQQGYEAAGINELIAQSGTSKKSFYQYFPSKHDLGAAFLEAEQQELTRFLSALTAKYPRDVAGFARAWSYTLKKAAGCGEFHGCPFANTALQAPESFPARLGDIMSDLEEQLTRYLTSSDLELPPREARHTSRLMLVAYEGAIVMWRLSADPKYFDVLEQALCLAARVQPKRGRGVGRVVHSSQ